MPYSSPHVLIVFAGALPGGEQWSIGFRTVSASPPADSLQTLADWYAEVFRIAWGSTGTNFALLNSTQVTMTTCTVRSIDTAGHTIAVAVGVPSGPVQGTNTAPFLPNQDALVVSLLTARAGRSFRGRVYLPCLNATLLATGRVDPASTRNVALGFVQQLIEGLNGANGFPLPGRPVPAAFFRVAIQSTTSGQPAAPVINVKCGDVMDTQRRRRDKLVEAYNTLPVPTPSG